MNISIEIDEPKTYKLKQKLNVLWTELESLPENNDAVTPAGREGKKGWLLHSEEALPFLEESLRKIRQQNFSYKICVCDVDEDEAAVWHRPF